MFALTLRFHCGGKNKKRFFSFTFTFFSIEDLCWPFRYMARSIKVGAYLKLKCLNKVKHKCVVEIEVECGIAIETLQRDIEKMQSCFMIKLSFLYTSLDVLSPHFSLKQINFLINLRAMSFPFNVLYFQSVLILF